MTLAMGKSSAHTELGGHAQDKVLSGYMTRFGLQEEEASNLHMFFSPTRVPKGMTREEVRIVLLLFSLRGTHRRQVIGSDKVEKFDVLNKEGLASALEQPDLLPELRELYETLMKSDYPPLPSFKDVVRETVLPLELVQSRMTRSSFKVGVIKLLECMANA